MFGSSWPHHLKIEGATSSVSQGSDGEFTSGSQGASIYDDKCDAQENNRGGGLKITTGDTQVKTETADLKIFLKDEAKINDLAVGMQGTLTRGSRTDRISITMIRLIDAMIEVNTI
jgi:hypothetical protein